MLIDDYLNLCFTLIQKQVYALQVVCEKPSQAVIQIIK